MLLVSDSVNSVLAVCFLNNYCIFAEIIYFVRNTLAQNKIENKKYVQMIDNMNETHIMLINQLMLA